MDYLLSREKTSSMRSNPMRARSILVNREFSTDDLHFLEFRIYSERKDKISDLKHELDV